MMFFVPLERRVDIQTALGSANGQFVNFGFTNDGAKAWRLE
jgi:galactokinase/mevalonate kinase-like predicted kinase